MAEPKIVCSTIAYNAAISACANCGEWDAAVQLLMNSYAGDSWHNDGIGGHNSN